MRLLQNALCTHLECDETRLELSLLLGRVHAILGQHETAISVWAEGLRELRTGRMVVGAAARQERLAELDQAFTTAMNGAAG